MNENLVLLKLFIFVDDVEVVNVKVFVLCIGYIGEDGFEIYCFLVDVFYLWMVILEVGSDEGVLFCGLGVCDMFCFEVILVLYG